MPTRSATSPAPHKAPSKTSSKASVKAAQQARDNERPLVEDIRFLGRLLGDVIREQEGKEAYELVEQVRKLSVAFRRDADADGADRRAAHRGAAGLG